MQIILVGDSTVANCPESEAPMAGWGQFLQVYLPDSIGVVNFAKGGSTTASFMEECLWKKVLTQIESEDIVCIQFGHNDQKPEKKIYSEDYANNLKMMVKEVRGKKGIPILITPPERNNFFRDKLFPTLEKEAQIIQTIASDNQVCCIDLHEKTNSWYQKNGEQKNREYFMWMSPGESANYPQGYRDNTHFKESGAKWIAEWIAEQLKQYMDE